MWGKVVDPAWAKARAASRPVQGRGAGAAKPDLVNVKEEGRRITSQADAGCSQPGQHVKGGRVKRVIESSPEDSEGSSPEPKQAAAQRPRRQGQLAGPDPPEKKQLERGAAGLKPDTQATPAAVQSKQGKRAAEPRSTHARKKRRASSAAGDTQTPAALRGQAQNLDLLVEAAAAAYSCGTACKVAPSPAQDPSSRKPGQPSRMLAAGGAAAAASPEKGRQGHGRGDAPAAARKLAQPAAEGATPHTSARRRPQTAAKPWWVV